MRQLVLLLLILTNLQVFGQSKKNEQLINETILKYKSHNSVSYDIEYMIKFFDNDEPNFVDSNVWIIKDPLDTIFNSKFVYNRRDSIVNNYKYYNSPYLNVISLNEEKIVRFDASKGHTSPITGNIDGDVLKIYFFDIERLERKINNTKNKVKYLDTENFLKITILYPDDEDFHDCEESFYIDKTNQTIQKITYQAKYKDQIQKNSWVLSNIEFNQIKFSDFENRIGKYLKTFKLDDYKPLTEEDYKLLGNGATAPKITGNIFPNYDKSIELNTEKIVILDFWYTSCMPCIKTIPHLNKLKDKFKDKIEIIGVNPIENKEKHKEKIENFIKRTPMDYPIFLVESIPSEYNIRAYPTLYILDKNRRVRYSKIGFSDNTYEELDKILNELINEK